LRKSRTGGAARIQGIRPTPKTRSAIIVCAPVVVMLAKLAHAAQIIRQNVSIAVGEPIVLKYGSERIHHVVEFMVIVTALREFILQLVQFINRSGETGLIAGEGKGGVLKVFHIFTNALEEIPMPAFTLEITVPFLLVLAVIAIQIAIPVIAGVTLLAAVIADIAAPGKVKTIFSGAGLTVINANYNGPAVARRTNEFLTSAAVHLIESKTGRIRRHGRRAVELPELRRRSAYVPEYCVISSNFHRGGTVNDNIQRTYSATTMVASP
jgi:hypothetical protein